MILKMCSLFYVCIIYLNSFLLFQCLFKDLDVVYMYWITKSTTHMCLFFVTFRLEKKRTFRIKSSGNCKKKTSGYLNASWVFIVPHLFPPHGTQKSQKKKFILGNYMTRWFHGKIFFKWYLIILQSLLTAYFYLFWAVKRFSHYFVVICSFICFSFQYYTLLTIYLGLT